MASLCSGLNRAGVFGTRQLAPRVVPCRASPVAAQRLQRGALQVVAAGEGEQAKKRTDSAVKRAQIAEERRKANKSRKSACSTRIKKVRGGCWRIAAPRSCPGSLAALLPRHWGGGEGGRQPARCLA